MKPAYFKGIQWTKVFVSGRLDPVHNKYKFYSQICKTNISLYSEGARETVRHYQSEGQLRKDQQWRYEHLASPTKLQGSQFMPLEGTHTLRTHVDVFGKQTSIEFSARGITPSHRNPH